jgi:non-specific serine/threonine protein kinase
MRYRLLEPLRAYAHPQFVTVGELESARRLHAEYVLAVAQQLGSERGPPSRLAWARELNAVADNIRLAHERAVESQNSELALRLAAALWMWWSRPDREAQGRLWLERTLAIPGTELLPLLRARVEAGLSFLSMLQGDLSEAVRLCTEARQTGTATADPSVACIASSVLGTALPLQGATDAAEPRLGEAIGHARTAGMAWMEILALSSLGSMALARGELATAEVNVLRSLRVSSAEQDAWTRATVLNNLGDVLRARGEVERAHSAYEKVLTLFGSLDPHRRFAPQGRLHTMATWRWRMSMFRARRACSWIAPKPTEP